MSILLLVLIMAGCASKPKAIDLPPKPERKEVEAPQNLKDMALLLNYYEHLVQEWEAWGEAVDGLTNNKN